jgi:hypothetical protein
MILQDSRDRLKVPLWDPLTLARLMPAIPVTSRPTISTCQNAGQQIILMCTSEKINIWAGRERKGKGVQLAERC